MTPSGKASRLKEQTRVEIRQDGERSYSVSLYLGFARTGFWLVYGLTAAHARGRAERKAERVLAYEQVKQQRWANTITIDGPAA